MIRVFDHVHWFLVTTRHSDDGAENRSVRETMGFSWNGPIMVMRLERRGANAPVGILSSEHHQAAMSAVERWVTDMIEKPPLTHLLQLLGDYVGRTQSAGSRKVEDLHRR